MASLAVIEAQTNEFSDERKRLLAAVEALQDELEMIKRKHLPQIQELAANVAAAQAALHETVKTSGSQFQKPKTKVFAGVRVGFKKLPGKVEIENEQGTVKLIRKHLPELFDQLVKTEEKVLKSALLQLSAAELKKIGAKVTDDTDEVYIKPIGDEIDKFVSALLEEGEQILRDAS